MNPLAAMLWAICAAFVAVVGRAFLPLLRARLFGWWAGWSLLWQMRFILRIRDKARRDAALDRWMARCARLTAEIEASE